jgi:hypothetical protein
VAAAVLWSEGGEGGHDSMLTLASKILSANEESLRALAALVFVVALPIFKKKHGPAG